jgi:hypothetical protein
MEAVLREPCKWIRGPSIPEILLQETSPRAFILGDRTWLPAADIPAQYWIIRGKYPASRGSIFLVTLIAAALVATTLVAVLTVGPTQSG